MLRRSRVGYATRATQLARPSAYSTEHCSFWFGEEVKIKDYPTNKVATYLWWKLDPAMSVRAVRPADRTGYGRLGLLSAFEEFRHERLHRGLGEFGGCAVGVTPAQEHSNAFGVGLDSCWRLLFGP